MPTSLLDFIRRELASASWTVGELTGYRIFLLPKSQKLEMQPYYSQSWHENATQWHIPMSLLLGSASPPTPHPPPPTPHPTPLLPGLKIIYKINDQTNEGQLWFGWALPDKHGS